MVDITATIGRQAIIFHQIEEVINNSEENYGFNIPVRYDIILGIYREVNEDLRKGGLQYHSDMIYNKPKFLRRKHGKSRK